MRQRVFAVALATALAIIGASCRSAVAPPANPDYLVTATWTEDFTNVAPCSSAVTTGCVSGFTWGYEADGKEAPLKTSPVTVCSGSTQPEDCSDSANSQLPIGTLTPFVIANGLDATGAMAESPATVGTGVLTVPVPQPSGLAATAK